MAKDNNMSYFYCENRVYKKMINLIRRFHHLLWMMCIVILLLIVSFIIPVQLWKRLYIAFLSQKVLITLVLIFCLITLSLVWSAGEKIDVMVFMLLNKHGKRPVWLDYLMLCATQLGNFLFAVATALILSLIGYHLIAFELILGLLTLGLVVQTIKILTRRKRPYLKLEGIRIIGVRESGRSFPSGHTSQAFFMASLLLHYYQANSLLWIVLYALAFFVGITRIYIGMHYPRDVIGGAALGTAWGILGVIINCDIYHYLSGFWVF